MNKIVVIGGGGNAKVLISILKRLNTHRVIGYTDEKNNGKILGVSYLGDDLFLEKIIKEEKTCSAVIGVGQITVSPTRKKIAENLIRLGFDIPAIVSDTALISKDTTIGKGTVVLDRAIVNIGSGIGDFCLINTGVIIEHDCSIGNFVHVASGAVLGGGVTVGEGSIIGLGSRVIQYKNICSNCYIGAGAVVTKDINLQGNYAGVPAKRIK